MLQYLPISLLAICLFVNNPIIKQTNNPGISTPQKNEDVRTVMVMPVDYFYFTWDEWGLPNDYLQEKLIADLSAAFPEKFRFYSEASINEQAVNPDFVIRMDFIDISIGQAKTTNEDYGNDLSIKTIKASSVPPTTFIKNNAPSFNFATTTVESKAILNCIFYNWIDDDTLLTQQFSGTHKWEGTAIQYRTLNNALRDRNNGDINNYRDKNISEISLKDEIAKKLMDICYKKALKKIKTELELKSK